MKKKNFKPKDMTNCRLEKQIMAGSNYQDCKKWHSSLTISKKKDCSLKSH
jgi:hypothetical protein